MTTLDSNYILLFEEDAEFSDYITRELTKHFENGGLTTALKYAQEANITNVDFTKPKIMDEISKYTHFAISNKEEIINNLKNDVLAINFQKLSNSLEKIEIKTSYTTISILPLSELLSLYPNSTELQTLLKTNKRYHICHRLANSISKIIDNPHQIVTGHIYTVSDLSEYLHTWLEFSYNGKDYVIDGTINAIINKEAYYLLHRAKVLSKLSNTTIANDLKTYPIIESISHPFYYLFRDEIINDLKRNKQLTKKKN